MAKTIATVGGIALAPGVSLNRRMYSKEAIGRLVGRAQKRIAAGDMPLTMLSHHAAENDSTRIVGRITSLAQDEDGSARFTAAIADTDAGRSIASLLDTSDGKPPFLKNVSIRGYWVGTVRKVKGPDDKPVETADDMELDGLDYTKSPGVSKAAVDTFAWSGRSGRTETTERVPLTESVREAHVTSFTDETAVQHEGEQSCADMGHECCKDANGKAEALRDVFGLTEHVLDDGICVTCEAATPAMSKRGSGLSGSGGPFADPGYQADKKQRYQLDSKAHAIAAWRFISKKSYAAKYSPDQLKRVKGRIVKALKKFGVKVASDESWAEGIREAIAECYADAESGSYNASLNNGRVCVTVSSYSVDPCDLDVIATAAMKAACLALGAMDPDMDGDIDVPGADSADDDGDNDDQMTYTPPGESAPVDDVTETTTDPAPDPAAEPTETEMPAMTDTATPAAEATPAATETTTLETAQAGVIGMNPDQFAQLLAAVRQPATETAPATPAIEAAAAPVAESADERMARLEKLAEQKIAEAAAAHGLKLQESDEDIVTRLVEKKLTPLIQAAAEAGHGVQRSGFTTGRVNENVAPSMTGGVQVNEHGMPAGSPNKPLHEYSDEELARYGHPLLVGHALGDRAAKLG